MIHTQRVHQIDATPDAVWAVLGDYMHVDEFAPFVTSVDALTDGADGVGSKRRVHFDNGNSLVEEVTEWEPNRRLGVRSSELEPMPLHELHADISVSPSDGGRSQVTWSVDFQVKYGPFGWLLGQTMMKMMMGKVLDGNLKGLAEKAQSANRTAA